MNIVLVLFIYGILAQKEFLSANNMDFTHWDNVVRKLVNVNQTIQGIQLNTFDYVGLVNNSDYDTFTIQVENANLTGITYNQFKAFWINVYNYLAVRVIFENTCQFDLFGDCRPLTSIRQVGEEQPSFFLNTVWDLKLLKINSMKEKLSLNDIEHGKLRSPPKPWKEDARIHACIVCASISCPNLRNRAYTVDDIDNEMTENTQDFLKNKKKGVDIVDGKLTATMIFNFFPNDFNNMTGPKINNTNSYNVTWFLYTYSPEPIKTFILLNPHAEVHFFNYNWDLNGDVGGLCTVDRVCYPWWALIATILAAFIVVVVIAFVIKAASLKDQYEPINST